MVSYLVQTLCQPFSLNVSEQTMTTQPSKPEKRYTSPPHKLVKFFETSRDAWKQKCREAKRTVKRLKHRVRVLEQRTSQWKTRAQELEEEVARLQSQQRVLETTVEALKKRSSPP